MRAFAQYISRTSFHGSAILTKIVRADIFVLLDDVQYPENRWKLDQSSADDDRPGPRVGNCSGGQVV